MHGDGDDEQAPNPNPSPAGAKRKRNLPGTPDPEAEVIALSPRTLTSASTYTCEVCGKEFRRDQNLQIHRRGHNLPWNFAPRAGSSGSGGAGKEPARKRVYVCPEEACVYHDPARALGDLTGIKKHYSRKHGEKKWSCDRCSKSYAVRTDWKAHSRICGNRDFECPCGTLFSRKDSFIVHRASCDASTTAEESDVDDGLSSSAPTVGFRASTTVNHELLFPSLWGQAASAPPEPASEQRAISENQ